MEDVGTRGVVPRVSSNTIVSHIPEDREAYLHIGKPRDPLPPFRLVGRGGRNKHGLESMDTIDLLLTMDADERFFFRILNKTFDWKTNIGMVPVKGMSRAEKNKVYRGYRKLRERDVVRRIKSGIYMINPTVIVPSHLQADEVMDDYMKL